MIGQTHLQSQLKSLIENGNFPRFSILVGLKGSGKKMMATEIKKMFNQCKVSNNHVYAFRVPDVKIDTIRDVIRQAYKTVTTAIYIIPDADNMSNAAKNALLKVTEEPPNNAYFIMTLEDERNTLETIRSRGTVFHMDIYTPDKIAEYLTHRYGVFHNSELSIITDICETPGEVDIITDEGIIAFYDYVKLVVNNIADVSLANAFKISGKVALKDGAEGYDLRLFWKAFIKRCFEVERYSGIVTTSKYLQKLQKGINKQMLFDNWMLEIREIWQSL